jgi:hypothetical protein
MFNSFNSEHDSKDTFRFIHEDSDSDSNLFWEGKSDLDEEKESLQDLIPLEDIQHVFRQPFPDQDYPTRLYSLETELDSACAYCGERAHGMDLCLKRMHDELVKLHDRARVHDTHYRLSPNEHLYETLISHVWNDPFVLSQEVLTQMENGADLDYVDPASGYSMLMLAVLMRRYNVVQLLLRWGVDKHYIAPDSNTALSLAMINQDSDMLRLLL